MAQLCCPAARPVSSKVKDLRWINRPRACRIQAARDMTTSQQSRRPPRGRAASWVAAVLLAACGGGGGENTPLPAFDSVGGIVVADLDGDGLDDVAAVVAHIDGPPPHAGAVKVWLQQTGTPGVFRAAARYPVGPDPWQLRQADVDGDGRPDLVAMSSHAAAVDGAVLVDSVAVLRGDPAQPGGFLPGATLRAGARLADITLADLDGDGHIDIAFTSYHNGARLGVWWNDPAWPGRFGDPVSLVATAAGALAAADLDGDGRPDLAYADGDAVWLLQRDPAAARDFLTPVQVGSGTHLSCLLATDLDGDGLADLAFGSRPTPDVGAPGDLVTRRNDPAQPGRFLALQRQPLAVHAGDCVAVDLQGDGATDLATVGAGVGGDLFDDVIEALLADPARPGGLLPAQITVTDDTAGGHHLAFGELGGDGRPEAVLPFDGGVLILRQDPARPGAFQRWRALP